MRLLLNLCLHAQSPPALLEALCKIPFVTMPLLSRLIDFETLEQCVHKLHQGKLTGVDGISRQFYRYGPQTLLELLSVALNAYLRGETPSVCAHEWIGALACYIPEKLSEPSAVVRPSYFGSSVSIIGNCKAIVMACTGPAAGPRFKEI